MAKQYSITKPESCILLTIQDWAGGQWRKMEGNQPLIPKAFRGLICKERTPLTRLRKDATELSWRTLSATWITLALCQCIMTPPRTFALVPGPVIQKTLFSICTGEATKASTEQ